MECIKCGRAMIPTGEPYLCPPCLAVTTQQTYPRIIDENIASIEVEPGGRAYISVWQTEEGFRIKHTMPNGDQDYEAPILRTRQEALETIAAFWRGSTWDLQWHH